jgi:hypothetical protein
LFVCLLYWGLNSGPTPWATPPALLWWVFSRWGSLELFAQAGSEPQSSWSLPPEYLGLQAWSTTWLHFFLSFFLVDVRFELKVSYLLGRHPTTCHSASLSLFLQSLNSTQRFLSWKYFSKFSFSVPLSVRAEYLSYFLKTAINGIEEITKNGRGKQAPSSVDSELMAVTNFLFP